MLTDAALETFETFALELADAAGRVALPLFRGEHGVVDKAGALRASSIPSPWPTRGRRMRSVR
jgi:hypothetical protein